MIINKTDYSVASILSGLVLLGQVIT